MISGRVAARHALVEVTIQIPGGSDFSFEVLIDTGFDGYLTLPPTTTQTLGLPFLRRITVSLADASTIHISAHLATILWDGLEREVEILATGTQPLLGTRVLDGYGLTVQFREGGTVLIEAL